MNIFKKILIGLGVLIVCAAGLVSVIQFLTSGITGAAAEFLQAMRVGNMQKASSYLSTEFKLSTPPSQLITIAQRSGLNRYESVSWANRSISTSSGTSRGELDGEMTTTDGVKLPISMRFIKEDGDWRIFSLKTDRGGIDKPQPNVLITVPENTDLVNLVNETMLAFAKSINAGNMQQFYDHTALLLQKQTSPDQLKTIFKAFIEQEINMLGLQQLSPVFVSSPAVNDDNVLRIKGHYPSQPLRVTFEHEYVREGTAWKLVSMNVNAKPVQQAKNSS